MSFDKQPDPDPHGECAAEIAHLREYIARLEAWAHEYGDALIPRGADTYGNGMRDAKAQVAQILNAGRKA